MEGDARTPIFKDRFRDLVRTCMRRTTLDERMQNYAFAVDKNDMHCSSTLRRHYACLYASLTSRPCYLPLKTCRKIAYVPNRVMRLLVGGNDGSAGQICPYHSFEGFVSTNGSN